MVIAFNKFSEELTFYYLNLIKSPRKGHLILSLLSFLHSIFPLLFDFVSMECTNRVLLSRNTWTMSLRCLGSNTH